ncbi:hypothetical protein CQA26_11470 [Providencia rettgeri]|nr:hypothetical protein CQA26_11470 [Providencia rettgeri]
MDRISRKIKINKNCCHEFTGSKDRCGYGRMKVGKHNLGAHKVLFLLVHGDYDQSKLEVMHSCDNPACVNIEHLSVGTHKQNMHDCISKGRHTYQGNIGKKFVPRGMARKSHGFVIAYKTSRSMAIDDGWRNYAGRVCQKHQSTMRRVSNGQCIYCYHDYVLKKREIRKEQKQKTK